MNKIKLLLSLVLCTILPIFSHSPEKIFEALQKVAKENPYLEESNSPTIITFSGTPGMGKTFLAKAIQERFHGVRLATDTVRSVLGKRIEGTLEPIINCLIAVSDNYLEILDSSIDRSYDTVAAIAQERNTPLITIRLKAPRDVVEQRILESKKDPAYYMRWLDKWYADYEAFGETGRWQLTFDSSQDSVEELLDSLESILKNSDK